MALNERNMLVLIFFFASPLPAFSLVASDNVCDGGSTVYKDCAAIKIGNTGAGTGTYDISVGCSDSSCCLTVYCEMNIMGGGWTVFQRRFDGSVNFFRNWTEYENGFGSVNAEHWLGLKHVQEMANVNTETHDLLLKVHEENYPNCLRYVHYSGFYLEDSSDNYRLRLSSRIATNLNMWSNGTDMMTVEKDKQFSTFDVDNDPHLPGSCAQMYYGGWWYGACHSNLMNGIYSPGCTAAAASITLWEASEHRYGFAGSMLGIRPTAYASAQPATNLCTQTDSQSCPGKQELKTLHDIYSEKPERETASNVNDTTFREFGERKGDAMREVARRRDKSRLSTEVRSEGERRLDTAFPQKNLAAAESLADSSEVGFCVPMMEVDEEIGEPAVAEETGDSSEKEFGVTESAGLGELAAEEADRAEDEDFRVSEIEKDVQVDELVAREEVEANSSEECELVAEKANSSGPGVNPGWHATADGHVEVGSEDLCHAAVDGHEKWKRRRKKMTEGVTLTIAAAPSYSQVPLDQSILEFWKKRRKKKVGTVGSIRFSFEIWILEFRGMTIWDPGIMDRLEKGNGRVEHDAA